MKQPHCYRKNIPIAATNIRRVVNPTTTIESRELRCPLMMVVSVATARIPTRRNGASTPFITAVQKSARIGFTSSKVSDIPITIETTMTE
jgi:hypothetical protein